jgi:hypothetical protein
MQPWNTGSTPIPARARRKRLALTLRANCEYCDKDLPPAAADARICSFECTFCAACVERKLYNVCPNCGGGFTPRPIRPAQQHRPGLSLATRPASTERVHLSYSLEDVAQFAEQLKAIAAADR